MTYAPLKHLHTKFRVIFSPLKQEYSFLIFLKTTVNSSKTVALGLVSSHLHEALPFHDSYQHFNFHKRSSLLEWGKKKMAVVAVCLAGTRGVHRCYRCPPRGSDKAVYFSPFHYFFIWFFFVFSSGAMFSGWCKCLFITDQGPKMIFQVHLPLISISCTEEEG